MSFSPVPNYTFREITDVSPEFLMALGVKLLMLDLDNTIAAYSEHLPADDVSEWLRKIGSCGIESFIVSNSVRDGRVEIFAKSLQLDFVKGASKPSPKAITQAMAKAGYRAGESAFIGDQVYTDVLAANRAGVVSIVVRPRRFTNPFLVMRYVLESPFRVMCKNRGTRGRGQSIDTSSTSGNR